MVSGPVGELVPNHGQWWGSNERALQAPEALLICLVKNVTEEAVRTSSSQQETKLKRLALANGNQEVLGEAIARLQAGERGRKWFVLEGVSYPDAYIETNNLILVVEGKRTERSTTGKTMWMPERSQLLRHMDAACAFADGRVVLGLLLVEGEPPDSMLAPQRWSQAVAADLDRKVLVPSLPHRTGEERQAIADGVLGVATWQRVCLEFAIDWSSLPDEV